MIDSPSSKQCPHPTLYARDMFNQPQPWGSCLLCERDSWIGEAGRLQNELCAEQGRYDDLRARHARCSDEPPACTRCVELEKDCNDLSIINAELLEAQRALHCEMEQEGEHHDLAPGVVCIQCWNREAQPPSARIAELERMLRIKDGRIAGLMRDLYGEATCPGCGKRYPQECDWCSDDIPRPPTPPKALHREQIKAICHALTDNCVMVDDPERPPCTFDNCAAMKAARADAPPNVALAVVLEQAEDEGLWFTAQTAPEAYLQQELRKLHAAVEGKQIEFRNPEPPAARTYADTEGTYAAPSPFEAKMDTSDSSPVTQQEIVSAISHHARELARLTETWPAVPPSDSALRDVAAERKRQVDVERWTPDHDDNDHSGGELEKAAACYALGADVIESIGGARVLLWPWEDSAWKPKDTRRNLVRAGALILAAIERIDRARAPSTKPATNGGMKPTCPNCGHEPCAEWCSAGEKPVSQCQQEGCTETRTIGGRYCIGHETTAAPDFCNCHCGKCCNKQPGVGKVCKHLHHHQASLSDGESHERS